MKFVPWVPTSLRQSFIALGPGKSTELGMKLCALFSCPRALLDGPWPSRAALEKLVPPWFLPTIVNRPIDSTFESQLCLSDMFLCWHIFIKFFFSERCCMFLIYKFRFFFFNFRIVSWHYFLDYVVASLIASIFDSLCLENIIFFLIFEKKFSN